MHHDTASSIFYPLPDHITAYHLTTDADTADILVALFAEQPVNGSVQHERGLTIYLESDADVAAFEKVLTELQTQWSFELQCFEEPVRNWNREWESYFDPVRVGDCVALRADFHEPIPDVRHEIVIQPEMAFGTGHHATTYMMLQALCELSPMPTRVLDYGCGTGVLALLAAMRGATEVEGVDIEAPAVANSKVHFERNGHPEIEVYQGTLDDVHGSDYGLILANIVRSVIVASLPALYDKLMPGGWLLVSGILIREEHLLCEALRSHHYEIFDIRHRGDWLCGVLRRPAV